MGSVVVGSGTVSMLVGSDWVNLGVAKDLSVVVIDDVPPDMDPLEFNCIVDPHPVQLQLNPILEPAPFPRSNNPNRGKRKARHRGIDRW